MKLYHMWPSGSGFVLQPVFEVRPCCKGGHCFIPFHGRILLGCMDEPYFCLFVRQLMDLGLFLLFGQCE